MSRPVTLFTGQWADLSLAELAPKVKAMGYDGVELDQKGPGPGLLSGIAALLLRLAAVGRRG